ncbi:MAG TPA: VWA domain-containing protein [Candidatus Limnocylindria bacterium]
MSRRFGPLWLTLLVTLLAGAPVAFAADPYRITITKTDLGSYPQVGLVASITDANGRPVKGLAASEVFVTEDRKPVTADVRLASEVAPVSVVFVIDTSGSMAAALPSTKAAAGAFIDTLTPADTAAVITFGTSATVAQGLTPDHGALHAAIDGVGAVGNTALYDALDAALAIAQSAPASSRRAVVLLTDGIDNSSSIALDALRQHVAAATLPIFLIGLGESVDVAVLQSIASASQGGRALVAPTSAELAAVYDGLAEQLRSDVAITYAAKAQRGARATVIVELRRAGAVLGRTELALAMPAAPGATATVTPAPTQAVAPIIPAQQNALDPAFGVALLGAATSGSFVLWLWVRARERSAAERKRRLDEHVRTSGPALSGGASRQVSSAVLASARRAVRPIRPLLPTGWVQRTQDWLVRAGEPLGLDAQEFIALRLALAVLLGIAATIAMLFIRRELLVVVIAALLGLALGYVIPALLVSTRLRARKRAMTKALPGALDLLALSTAAGLTLDGAIAQVVQRWDTPLSDEFRRYLAEVRVGSGRREALHALAKRVDLPEMTHLTTTILQADVLGVPIANVLREQAAELRRDRRQKAEEAARLAPVKMLFPMALLIFPALFVVILGPVVPAVLSAFGS